jgi:hypothetical protein
MSGDNVSPAPEGVSPLGHPSHPLPPIPPVSVSGPMVDVRVGQRIVQIPERVLCVGLSDLGLATEVYVGLQDYAVGVGLVLRELNIWVF